MIRILTWIVVAASVVLVALGGATASTWLGGREPQGYLDTVLAGVTVTEGRARSPAPASHPGKTGGSCWPTFGGSATRTLTRPYFALGLPRRRPIWSLGLKSYIEFPPAYCNGMLYVNTFGGA